MLETPEKLPHDIVESVVDIWNRKPRHIAVLMYFSCFYEKKKKKKKRMLKGGGGGGHKILNFP